MPAIWSPSLWCSLPRVRGRVGVGARGAGVGARGAGVAPMTFRTSFLGPEQIVESWPEWGLPIRQRPQVLGPVPGGLTNRNHRLRAPGLDHDLLLRINHPEPGRLGIDRAAEQLIVDAVARRGIGRPMLYRDPFDRYCAFPWLDARPWTRTDLDDPRQLDRLWRLIESLATIRLPLPRRSYHAYVDHYWQQVQARGLADIRLEQAWREFEPRLGDFDRAGWQARLTHHDLVPANILDTGDRLVLIDWEYAAPGHPDIDRWTVDSGAIAEPFIGEMMGWINRLWARLIQPAA